MGIPPPGSAELSRRAGLLCGSSFEITSRRVEKQLCATGSSGVVLKGGPFPSLVTFQGEEIIDQVIDLLIGGIGGKGWHHRPCPSTLHSPYELFSCLGAADVVQGWPHGTSFAADGMA